MLFFDLWEPSLLWRGRLDIANNKVVEGEVTTNKKRFGLFPYTETLATFEAELLAPGQKLPTVVLPNFSDLRFTVRFEFKLCHYHGALQNKLYCSQSSRGRIPGNTHSSLLSYDILLVICLPCLLIASAS